MLRETVVFLINQNTAYCFFGNKIDQLLCGVNPPELKKLNYLNRTHLYYTDLIIALRMLQKHCVKNSSVFVFMLIDYLGHSCVAQSNNS